MRTLPGKADLGEDRSQRIETSNPVLDESLPDMSKRRRFASVLGVFSNGLRRLPLAKVLLFCLSLSLFVLAISLMKDGAKSLAPLVREYFPVNNLVNCLGFGWIFAYLVMSGSPVAAASLAFFDAGAIDPFGAFAMITGSRLGASFIVLFLGFIYMLRGRDRATSLSMGLLSFVVTGLTYGLGLFIGIAIMQMNLLDFVHISSSVVLSGLMERFYTPLAGILLSFLPRWALFFLGMGIIILSFKLFDRCLPQMAIKESHVGGISRLVYRPWVMFILGALVTLISMSVSMSLSILVPLSSRGFVRRENVIPYIMGANITTFVDTLFAALLFENPYAFVIVLTEIVSIVLVSLFILIFIYRHYERMMLHFVARVTETNRNVLFFMFAILLIPIFLLFA